MNNITDNPHLMKNFCCLLKQTNKPYFKHQIQTRLCLLFHQCAVAVAWKRPVVSHDVWVMVRDTIYAQHDTWKTTNFWKYKALEHHIIQTNRKNNKLNTFLPLCRAVAWKRPVVSHDVWVVRDTIYVQQTSCWLP